MKEKLINFWNKFTDIVTNYWFGIFFAMLLGAIITFNFTCKLYSQQENENKINAVREFVAHPSLYNLDTLYKKVNDTLYVDTIKVSYSNVKQFK